MPFDTQLGAIGVKLKRATVGIEIVGRAVRGVGLIDDAAGLRYYCCNLGSDIGLNGEAITRTAIVIVGLRPQDRAVFGFDQTGCDTDARAGDLHAAGQKVPAELLDVRRATCDGKVLRSRPNTVRFLKRGRMLSTLVSPIA